MIHSQTIAWHFTENYKNGFPYGVWTVRGQSWFVEEKNLQKQALSLPIPSQAQVQWLGTGGKIA